jgi:hypothetical protein
MSGKRRACLTLALNVVLAVVTAATSHALGTAFNTIDADGVAPAAIQGLYQLVQEKDVRIAALEARLGALEAKHDIDGAAAIGAARGGRLDDEEDLRWQVDCEDCSSVR